jgi:hypothetical protein
MLPSSRLLCNRPDKQERLLISAAQRLRSVLGMLKQLGGESPPPNLMEVKG